MLGVNNVMYISGFSISVSPSGGGGGGGGGDIGFQQWTKFPHKIQFALQTKQSLCWNMIRYCCQTLFWKMLHITSNWMQRGDINMH